MYLHANVGICIQVYAMVGICIYSLHKVGTIYCTVGTSTVFAYINALGISQKLKTKPTFSSNSRYIGVDVVHTSKSQQGANISKQTT